MNLSESWKTMVNQTSSVNDSDYTDEGYDDKKYVKLCDKVGGLEEVTAGCFLVIFLLSVTGNGLLLVALCRYEDLRRVTNLFILNLLASDLLFTLTLPFWAVYYLSHWMFGDLACKLLTGAYFTGLYSSMMLLTSMTVYRCVIVVASRWTAVPRRRLRYALAACTASWVVSLAASLSDVIASQVQEVENGTRIFTCEVLPGTTDEELGYYLQVSLLFVLPLIIIILCYSAILRTVLVTATRRRHRTVLVIFCIVVAFFVCWAPYNLFMFVSSVYTPVDCVVKERLHVVHVVCRIVAYAHCFLNPALYMLSHSFRQHLWSLLCCLMGEERGGQGGGGERSVGHSMHHITSRPKGPALVLQDPRENKYTATWTELRSEQE
ncbi:chemokine XC receptor 1-like [Salmo trutta]|uniref:Chemokine XC receptor 1-like n=1 Tax=Salmo trutta TaxID=8032 RepID=A0A674BKT0_SALTR|nr:chemokine XC receptor 1-like [Salmo trutta]XP_029582515.1 chemokine XC receptor 1-like [Salmo trutta]XP_029582516.1 chemokine XC receptor 1-like [Salmo trutta]